MIWVVYIVGVFSGFCIGHRIGASRCDHIWGWLRNTHGDEINHCTYRTVFKCEKCGKQKYIRGYVSREMAIHIHSSKALSEVKR